MEQNRKNKLRKVSNIRFLSDNAYKIIKDAIITLKIKPGEKLKISALTKELGISATPTREALNRLAQEGFVDFIPYRGAFVSEIDCRSVEEIFELRELLEAVAVKKAVLAFTSEDLHKAETLLDGMRNALFEANDINSYLKLSEDFHNLFIKKCGNKIMMNVLGSFNDHLERMRKMAVSRSGSILAYIEDYRRIYNGLKDKNPEEAEQALLVHLGRAKESLLKGEEDKDSK